MTTTIDASGVEVLDDVNLVAVRVLSPRAAWNRMKIRTLQAMRNIRKQAAARQAAIAQFVKPYWERIPSGLLGFTLLATMAHTPAYRWVMHRVRGITGLAGRVIRTGLTWGGRATRWLGRSVAGMLGFFWPSGGQRMTAWVNRSSISTSQSFNTFCSEMSRGHQDFYRAATTVAATRTMTKFAFPFALGVGVNMVSQGLLAALVSGIPFIGLPLAAAISTTRGMSIVAATIGGFALADGYGELRKMQADEALITPVAGMHKAEEPVDVTPSPADAPVAAEGPVATTKSDVLADGTPVVVVEGAETDEEAQQLALAHEAQAEADSEQQLRDLEAEVAPQTAAQKRAAAKAHGPQPAGKRGPGRPRGSGKKAVPAPTPSR